MKRIHETMSELSVLVFWEVRTRDYIHFSYLIKEKSCLYYELYGRIKKTYTFCSQKAQFSYSPCLILSYI